MNWYVEVLERQGSKARAALYPTPGYASFATPGLGTPGRGLFTADGRLFAVAHQTLFEVDSAGTVTVRGTVVSDGNPAYAAYNGEAGDELLVASGGRGYLLTLATNSFQQVLASGCHFVGFLDGFFLRLDNTTSTLGISDLRDGTTWQAGLVARRSRGADPWKSMLVVPDGDVWLFGDRSTDVYYNSGAGAFPFTPIDGVLLNVGVEAVHSPAKAGDSVLWLGKSDEGGRMVWRSGPGYTPQRVSDHGVEAVLRTYTTVDDAVGHAYQEEGHLFYLLDFPTEDATWVFDLATGMWHERGYWSSDLGAFQVNRAVGHAYLFDRHLVIDRVTGNIFDQDLAQYSEPDGNEIRRVRRAPHLSLEHRRLFYPRLELDVETGVGLTDSSAQGSDPQIVLRWSNDGGRTFGNGHARSLGALGEYPRVQWYRLGTARDRVFEAWVSDPVGVRIMGAYLSVEAGLH